MSGTAVYTTFYPGMEPYGTAWAQSLASQTDSDFDLWIGIDQLSNAEIDNAAAKRLVAKFVFGRPGDTPAMVRNRALEQIVEHYDAIIFIDSDDILAATRVEAAKRFLQHYDVAGTAMYLIDQTGTQLEAMFAPQPLVDYAPFLFRWNVFGMSNTVYRSEVVRGCLPIPRNCIAVDWYLATMSLLHGFRLGFDQEPQMYYRQYGTNTARVMPPFTREQVLRAAGIVQHHQQVVVACSSDTVHKEQLLCAQQEVTRFCHNVLTNAIEFDRYLQALNTLPMSSAWWTCVAHPDLEELWNR